MSFTTLSSREFNQDVGAAKRAASVGPVVMLDGGRPAHVLVSYEEWLRVKGQSPTIGELLAMPGAADVELELPERGDPGRTADLA